MTALHVDSSPINNINFFNHLKNSVSKIADDLIYKSVYSAFAYINAEMEVLVSNIEKLNDEKYIEAIKQIDFEGMYDNHFEMRDKIYEIYEGLKDKRDIKSKKVYNILDELTNHLAKFELACADLEHLLILDKKRAS